MRVVLSYAVLAAFMVTSTFIIGNLAASYERQLFSTVDAAVSAALTGSR